MRRSDWIVAGLVVAWLAFIVISSATYKDQTVECKIERRTRDVVELAIQIDGPRGRHLRIRYFPRINVAEVNTWSRESASSIDHDVDEPS